jgi:tetratricopeptide (TPR) repeat protein
MATQKEAFDQALNFIHAGELDKARELLARLIKADKTNIDYWLWMSTVVKTTKERVYCLREILALDPKNEDASLGLRMLGEKAPDVNPLETIPVKTIPWKTRLEIADEHPSGPRAVRPRVFLYVILGVVIIAVFGYGILNALKPTNTQSMDTVKRWTITPLPSATFTNTPGPTATGFVPLTINVGSTMTPTAMYVATPHNRLEAYNAAIRAYEKGNWDSALEYFNQVLVDEPNSPDIYYHIGDVYRFQGKYKEALIAYSKAIKLDANFAPSYLGRARVYLDQTPSNPKEAIASLETAITKDPQMAEAYLELARANIAQGDANSALVWVDKYTQYAPDNATSCYYRALAYLELGDTEKALTEIKKANTLDLTMMPVYKIWAITLISQGQYRESIPLLLTVVKDNPLDTDAQAYLARAYYAIGDAKMSESIISTILEQDEKNVEILLLQGDVYLDQGEYNKANASYEQVLNLDYANFDANIGLGRVFLAKGTPGSAFNQFEYAKKRATNDMQKAIIVYWEAKSLQDLHEEENAITYFEIALDYPSGTLPQALYDDAVAQLQKLYTPTPTSTVTITPTITKTPIVTATATSTPAAAKSSTP